MDKAALYLLTTALLVIGAYLQSPAVVACSVLLWGIAASEAVFTRKNKDKDIVLLTARADAYEKRLKELDAHITNVAERAQTVLGEVF